MANQTLTDFLKGIADAIRTKDKTTAKIPASTMKSRILAIQTGTDTSDATATASDIVQGKTAYIKTGKVTGTKNVSLQSKTVTPSSSQQIVTPDPGYYGLDSVTVGADSPAQSSGVVPYPTVNGSGELVTTLSSFYPTDTDVVGSTISVYIKLRNDSSAGDEDIAKLFISRRPFSDVSDSFYKLVDQTEGTAFFYQGSGENYYRVYMESDVWKLAVKLGDYPFYSAGEYEMSGFVSRG